MFKRTKSVNLVLVILIISIVPSAVAQTEQNNNDTMSSDGVLFSSNLHIQYDTYPLNEELTIDTTVSLLLTITYQTDVPSYYLRILPWQIRNMILFDNVTAPMQKIHLEILDEPSWASITLSSYELLSDFPFADSPVEVQTTLLIQPYDAAPALPYTFKIKASCDVVGKIDGAETAASLTFTPSWVPRISINPEYSEITAPAGSLVNIKIDVENLGNAESLCIGTMKNLGMLSASLSPCCQLIPENDHAQFTLHIGIPETFTHSMRSIELEFTPYNPYRNEQVGGSHTIYIQVNGAES